MAEDVTPRDDRSAPHLLATLAFCCVTLASCSKSESRPAAQAPPPVQPALAVVTPVKVTGDAVQTEVPLEDDGGTFVVPVTINDALTLKFTIDSGAADVNIPSDVASTLVRTGTITRDDFIGNKTFMLADGTTVPSAEFRIKRLQVGTLVLHDVVGSLGGSNGSLLLGQSFLSRLSTWSVDNKRHALLLKSAPGEGEQGVQVAQATPRDVEGLLSEADLARVAGEFNETLKEGGMSGVSALVDGCYSSIADVMGSVAKKRAAYCITLDILAVRFDTSYQKAVQEQTGRPFPATPYFEEEKWKSRVASYLPKTGLPETDATTAELRGYVSGANEKLAALMR